MKPSIGMIVHYYDATSTCYAAIIASVLADQEEVSLVVFNSVGGGTTGVICEYSALPKAGYWSWAAPS